MTQETSSRQMEELNQMMGWDFSQPGKGSFEENAVVPEIWYYMELVRIGKPFISKTKFGDKTKSVFEFVIVKEADKNNQPVDSEFAGGKIPAFVNIDARDPEKSTMYPMTSALLGQDAKEYCQENGPIQPEDLLHKSCWVKVSNSSDDKGNIKRKLPQAQYSVGKNANQKIGALAQQPVSQAKPLF
jgi:hypothetical protein